MNFIAMVIIFGMCLALLAAISKIVDHVQEQGVSRRKSAAYVEYVSILRRFTTQLLGVRCIFEIASKVGDGDSQHFEIGTAHTACY